VERIEHAVLHALDAIGEDELWPPSHGPLRRHLRSLARTQSRARAREPSNTGGPQ
jgi:hypothetical protein